MTEPICRRCGCTEECACFDDLRGPCSWVEAGLCSHCRDTLNVLEEFERKGADEAQALTLAAHHVDQLLKMLRHANSPAIPESSGASAGTTVIRTLKEALGDGARAPDFEQYLVDYQAILKTYDHMADPDVRQLVRFMHLFSVAAVEGGREASKVREGAPGDGARIINLMVKGATISIGCAICSVLNDNTPAAVLREAMRIPFEQAVEEVIRSQGLK